MQKAKVVGRIKVVKKTYPKHLTVSLGDAMRKAWRENEKIQNLSAKV